MILFCDNSTAANDVRTQVIIPFSRVFEIFVAGCRITINYNSGEYTYISDEKCIPKIESCSIRYNSEDSANKAIRQFYKVCRDNGGVFYFSPNDK